MTGTSSEINKYRDYYADLELPPTADTNDIKRNHRKLALRYHPDRNFKEDTEEKFKIIKTAYDILSDPEQKALHDERRHNNPGPSEYPTPRQPNQARAGTTPWREEQPQRYYHFAEPKAKVNNGAPTTAAGRKRQTPHPPSPRKASARGSAEASFGSRNNGSHSRTDSRAERPEKSSNYRPAHTSSPYAGSPNPDTSAQAPPPVPQSPSSTAKTDPPNTMDKDNTPPTNSTPAHQPPEFPVPQPAQTTSSHHPFEPPKQPQQPAESKQSSGTIPMPSAGQDTNDEPAWTEWRSDNTPNANEKRPGNPKTPFDLGKEGSGGGREFLKVCALSFPTPPTAPQIPALIHGVQPSETDRETYLEDFKNYLKQWNLFKIQIIGHYCARKETITKLQNSGSGDIQQYYDWLVQDDDVRGLFIEAGEEHERQFRQFREFMMSLSSSNTGYGDK
ncbi:25S rRNA (adenine-N(1))-methyltransferase [Fusarium oxysporum f. sp. albedinis]|nr:25S rRNA (adenine-N(1))-methyltransferase [Fusarium oxysporum f. sp. albedinis]